MTTGTPRRVRSFPYDRLAGIARAQVEAGRTLRRHLPLVGDEAFAALASALGGAISCAHVEAYAFPVRDLWSRLHGQPAPHLLRLGLPGERWAVLAVDPVLVDGVCAGYAEPREVVLGALLRPLLSSVGARLEGLLAEDAELVPLFPDPLVLALDARVTMPFGDGNVRLLAPERLRLFAPRARRASSVLALRARLAGARASLVMEIGRTRLPRRELAGLGPGDVLLFEEFGPRPPFGGPLLLRLGRGAIRAHLDGEGLTILKGYELGALNMEPPKLHPPDEAAHRDDDTTDALLRELPVEIVCELGRVSLSGRELLELLPGAVLPVGRPLAGPVDLTVGGRVVARGELVDVEGEIGVRVVQLLG